MTELDNLMAEFVEPFDSLPVRTAHEVRVAEWGGDDPNKWTWTTSDYITSPKGMWVAVFGTDHGQAVHDHAPVVWTENWDVEPSLEIEAAWKVVAEMRERGWFLTLQEEGGSSQQWVASFATDDTVDDHVFGGEELGPTAPLAICRAALSAIAFAASSQRRNRR